MQKYSMTGERLFGFDSLVVQKLLAMFTNYLLNHPPFTLYAEHHFELCGIV
jgi:hypothetical protein